MSGKMVTRCFASALALFIAASVLCGIVYPWAVTGLSAIAFPYQATGSIIEVDGVKYGSELVGQPFKSDTHLWGRPTVVDAGSFSDAEGQPLLWYSPRTSVPRATSLPREWTNAYSRCGRPIPTVPRSPFQVIW